MRHQIPGVSVQTKGIVVVGVVYVCIKVSVSLKVVSI